jgi:hypothetical protein
MYNFKQREAEIYALYSKILARDNEPKTETKPTSTSGVEDLAKAMGIDPEQFRGKTEKEIKNPKRKKSIFEK